MSGSLLLWVHAITMELIVAFRKHQGHARWLSQIVSIENKGFAAFEAGVPIESCPYQDGYHNQNGRGGSVQRQRRAAWRRGWELAKRQQEEDRQS